MLRCLADGQRRPRVSGASCPTRSVTGPVLRPSSSTWRPGSRASSQPSSVIAVRWERLSRWRRWVRPRRAGGWASSISVARPTARRTSWFSKGSPENRRGRGNDPMRTDTLNVLRCPYCGGRLELVTSMFHRADGDRISEGILGCHCCIFPVVDGIPVLHLHPPAIAARDHLEAARPDRALQTMVGLEDEAQAARFEAGAAAGGRTYRGVGGD